MKTTFEVLPAMLSCSFAFAASAQDATISADVEAEAHATRTTRTPTTRAASPTDTACARPVRASSPCRTRSPGKHCAIGPDQVHTSEDTQHTGTTGLGEALRRLEPSSR